MRFAVIGDAPSVGPFLRSVAAHAEHELAALAISPDQEDSLRKLAPGARVVRGWEELLSDNTVDAVAVCGNEEETLNAARQLAAAGVPLLVSPAAGQTATFAYEMALVLADRHVCLVPAFASRANPLVAKLTDSLASGSLGGVQHVQLERRIVPARATGDLTPADVARAFLPDADLLRWIGGEYDQVTAVRSMDERGGIHLIHITLAGPKAPQVIWSAAVATDHPFWKLTVVAQRGTAKLEGDGEAGSFALEISPAGKPPERESLAFDATGWLLSAAARKIRLLRNPGAAPAAPASETACPDWDDFTRAVELFDAIERSVRRRRTIDIHFETPSERGQFKTQMTAVGCGVLLVTLCAFTAYLLAETLFEFPGWIKRILWVLTFLPLGAFLVLQALLFVARPSRRRSPSAGDPPVAESAARTLL